MSQDPDPRLQIIARLTAVMADVEPDSDEAAKLDSVLELPRLPTVRARVDLGELPLDPSGEQLRDFIEDQFALLHQQVAQHTEVIHSFLLTLFVELAGLYERDYPDADVPGYLQHAAIRVVAGNWPGTGPGG